MLKQKDKRGKNKKKVDLRTNHRNHLNMLLYTKLAAPKVPKKRSRAGMLLVIFLLFFWPKKAMRYNSISRQSANTNADLAERFGIKTNRLQLLVSLSMGSGKESAPANTIVLSKEKVYIT